jgi:phytoene desaturase
MYVYRFVMSPSCLLVLLGVAGRVAGLRHHNLFFDEPLEQHAKEIYQGASIPQI